MTLRAGDLPPRTTPAGTPYRVAVVCLGNICRSPMADVVINDRLQSAGLDDRVEVISAGTGGWHVGGPMDRRAAALLTTHGYDATRHRAQQFGTDWFDDVDLVLAMDADNFQDLVALGPADRVRMFRDFDPRASAAGDRDVPDPYFGGDDGFEDVLAIVERTADALVRVLAETLDPAVDPVVDSWRRTTDMARASGIAHRAEALLGTPVVATSPVAGGDICTATRLKLSNGSSALVKTRPHAPADFFPTEARGLTWLAEAGGVPTPEVLAVEEDCLILAWVEESRPTGDAADAFGRGLAATHAAGSAELGGGGDGYIGTLPLPNRTAPTWPEFYATRRVLPYLKLARDRGGISPADANAVDQVVRRIVDLAGPDESPARLHGDLWSGNLVWTSGAVWLVDPAAHGGHRETDLAMLALFGCPQLPRVLDAYQEATPLADGWEDRVALHQLFPLLVHACLFGHGSGGSGYGARAGEAARSLL